MVGFHKIFEFLFSNLLTELNENGYYQASCFEEEIIIKRFMGYNRARIYSPIVILCILVLVLDFVASQVIRCRISSVLVLIMGIFEIILFYIAIEKGAYKRIVSFLKS